MNEMVFVYPLGMEHPFNVKASLARIEEYLNQCGVSWVESSMSPGLTGNQAIAVEDGIVVVYESGVAVGAVQNKYSYNDVSKMKDFIENNLVATKSGDASELPMPSAGLGLAVFLRSAP